MLALQLQSYCQKETEAVKSRHDIKTLRITSSWIFKKIDG